MPHPFARTEVLIGQEGIAWLRDKHVLVAGLGGVGGCAAEALAPRRTTVVSRFLLFGLPHALAKSIAALAKSVA